jgi:hypothetical protein
MTKNERIKALQEIKQALDTFEWHVNQSADHIHQLIDDLIDKTEKEDD